MKTNNLIKQDINFLDKPLWFQSSRHDGLGFVWKDIDGYIYRTGYKPPDKLDILFLLYILRKIQRLDYKPEKLLISRYEILKECGYARKKPEYYYPRLEDSLKRWSNISIEFHGTFYDGNTYLSMGFGIIDSYKINIVTKLIEIKFNEDWLLKIKESTFFKYINFEYYKALKRAVTRRLYELLCKTFKGRDEWSIGLVKLGTKLTLSSRTVTTKTGEKKVMYASDVIVAVKPAINEINRLSNIKNIIEKTGIHPDDLFTVKYNITGQKQDRIIHFKKKSISLKKGVIDSHSVIELKAIIPPEHREKKTINTMLTRYFKKKGLEYVKRNIEYANNNHKKNYRTFLEKALKEDWAKDSSVDQAGVETKSLTKGALDCYTRNHGNCGAIWANHKNNIGNICHYCQKFKTQREKL